MNRDAWVVAALVAANVVPLVGVVALDWRLYDVMLIYWLENGVIGLFTLLRMATAGSSPAATLAVGPFFVFHYGLFWVVHGVFVVTLFGDDGVFASFDPGVAGWAAGPGALGGPPAYGPTMWLPIVGAVPLADGAAVALAGLMLSHGVSFVQTWLVGGERRGVSPTEVMARPYGRVVVLHVTLLVGGFAVLLLGAPALALVLMVGLKIGVDVAAHRRTHRAARAGADGA